MTWKNYISIYVIGIINEKWAVIKAGELSADIENPFFLQSSEPFAW